jgi:RES domain-containing protein
VEQLPVGPRIVEGTWIRHVPHGADLLGRADTPSHGRWQRGDVVRALYLADTLATATAEWYRSLAEWGLSPQDHIHYDHHRWRLDLELADLSDVERLRSVSLEGPRPSRSTWPAYQVGEQLWREGWAGLIAPSTARIPDRSSHVCSRRTGCQPAAHRSTRAPCKPSRHHRADPDLRRVHEQPGSVEARGGKA